MMHARRSLSIVLAFALLLAPAPWAPLARADEPSAAPSIKVLGVGRVRLELTKKQALIVADVNVARGGGVGGGGEHAADETDLFFAFGAPGAPRAVEAWLVPVAAGALEPSAGERGASLAWSYARKRPAVAVPVLGRPSMAGVVVHVPEAPLARALAPRGMATLRVRSVGALPAPEASGAREWVIRLGDGASGPLILGRVEIATSEAGLVERAEARFCRAGVLGERVAVRVVTPEGVRAREPGLPAPVLSSRKAGEDLCIRVMSARAP